MVVSLMVRPMAVPSGSGSWFGFQVGLGVAGASGFQDLGQRRWSAWLPVAELIDHDHVLGTARAPGLVVVGEREVIGVPQLAHVLFCQPLGWDTATLSLAGGSGFAGCLVGDTHWPASLSAASLD